MWDLMSREIQREGSPVHPVRIHIVPLAYFDEIWKRCRWKTQELQWTSIDLVTTCGKLLSKNPIGLASFLQAPFLDAIPEL